MLGKVYRVLGVVGLDTERPGADRLAVEKQFDGVFAGREAVRVLHVELGGCLSLVGDVLFRLADEAAGVEPARLDLARAGAIGQYRRVDRVRRFEAGGETADGLIGIQAAAQLNGVELQGLLSTRRRESGGDEKRARQSNPSGSHGKVYHARSTQGQWQWRAAGGRGVSLRA